MLSQEYPRLFSLSTKRETLDLMDNPDKRTIREIQLLLQAKGFKIGVTNGELDLQTAQSIAKAKNYLGLQYPCLISPKFVNLLYQLGRLGEFFSPTNGKGVLSSKYGHRENPIGKIQEFNHGVDLLIEDGSPVHAVDSGFVSSVSSVQSPTESFNGGYGCQVTLTHENGFFTDSVYSHLSAIHVIVGQSIGMGQVIARSGQSGNTKGVPKLHFQLNQQGISLDPTDLFPLP